MKRYIIRKIEEMERHTFWRISLTLLAIFWACLVTGVFLLIE